MADVNATSALPKALIELGNRCNLNLSNMGWDFAVDKDGNIIGSKMMPSPDGHVPIMLRIEEKGPVRVIPYNGFPYDRECTATAEEVRTIRRELPGACDEAKQRLAERMQDAGLGYRIPYCSGFSLSDDDVLTIDLPIRKNHRTSKDEDCYIEVSPNGNVVEFCLPTTAPVGSTPMRRDIDRFNPKSVQRAREILRAPQK